MRISETLAFLLLGFHLLTVACAVDQSRAEQPVGPGFAAQTPALATDSCVRDAQLQYGWPGADSTVATICDRFGPLPNSKRLAVENGSFASWLRHLPLLADGAPVLLFNGTQKGNQTAHVAVLNIDVGKSDLQQCADAVMRLRAEYLFATGAYNAIAFNATNGVRLSYLRYCAGERMNNAGKLTNTAQRRNKEDHSVFRDYMNAVFMYAGTLSLSRELIAIPRDSMQIGDVFIKGGSPGHACLVVDLITDSKGNKQFMLLQSYMPAQQIQVLHNPNVAAGVPWFPLAFGDVLETPEWEFTAGQLMRF